MLSAILRFIQIFAGASSKIEVAIFLILFFSFLLKFTLFHKLYINLFTKKGIFMKIDKRFFVMMFASKLFYHSFVKETASFFFSCSYCSVIKGQLISPHQILLSTCTKSSINSFFFLMVNRMSE